MDSPRATRTLGESVSTTKRSREVPQDPKGPEEYGIRMTPVRRSSIDVCHEGVRPICSTTPETDHGVQYSDSVKVVQVSVRDY